MVKFTRITDSDDRENASSTCGLSDNFSKVKMLDHEYFIPALSSLTSELKESDRAFLFSGDQIDFLQEGFGETIC